MRTETTKRILAAVITIPIAVSLTGCGGQDSKKSEPKKPAVTSSQSVKDEKAAKEKAQAEAKAKQEVETAAKAQAPAAQQRPPPIAGINQRCSKHKSLPRPHQRAARHNALPASTRHPQSRHTKNPPQIVGTPEADTNPNPMKHTLIKMM